MKIKHFSSFLPLYIIALLLFSCNTDETVNYEEQLEGEWVASEITYSGTAETTFNDILFSVPFDGEGKDLSLVLDFNSTTKKVTASGGYTLTINYTILNQNYSEEIVQESIFSSGDWSVEGKTLNITNGEGEITKFDILKATDTELWLETKLSENSTLEGNDVSYTATGIAKFNRQ